MKNVLVFACCVVGFLFIAAPTAIEHHQVLINGKSFANAVVINGQLFVSMEDFAKADTRAARRKVSKNFWQDQK